MQKQLSSSQICCQRNGTISDAAALYSRDVRWGTSAACVFRWRGSRCSGWRSSTPIGHELQPVTYCHEHKLDAWSVHKAYW